MARRHHHHHRHFEQVLVRYELETRPGRCARASPSALLSPPGSDLEQPGSIGHPSPRAWPLGDWETQTAGIQISCWFGPPAHSRLSGSTGPSLPIRAGASSCQCLNVTCVIEQHAQWSMCGPVSEHYGYIPRDIEAPCPGPCSRSHEPIIWKVALYDIIHDIMSL